MEWTFGITVKSPRTWRRTEPRWEDEQLKANMKNTYHEVMGKLCETALARRREDGDYGINAHLWSFEICSENELMKPRMDPVERVMAKYGGGYDLESSDDTKDEDEPRHIVMVMPEEEIKRNKEISLEDYSYVASSSKICKTILPEGQIIKVTYDFGNTTTIYLEVLSVKHKAETSLLQYFEAESGEVPGHIRDLQAIPAYKWPKEQLIDAFFPNYSGAFLGKYTPLLRPQNENQQQLKYGTGSASLGLSARIRSKKDTVFATVEDSTGDLDLMFAGMVFKDWSLPPTTVITTTAH
jgi:hypothetical protein